MSIKVKMTPSVKLKMDEKITISLIRVLNDFCFNPAGRAGVRTEDAEHMNLLFDKLNELDLDWRPKKGM